MTPHETAVQYIKILLAIIFLGLCIKAVVILGEIERNTSDIYKGSHSWRVPSAPTYYYNH